jgi:hypothetical protein
MPDRLPADLFPPSVVPTRIDGEEADMTRAFILSHGSRVPGNGTTFVPEGKSISFYSEYDQNTLRSIGLAALNAGDIEPVDTFKAGDPIPNYRLSQFEDSAIAQHLAAESSATNAKLYFVGQQLPSPTALCTTPADCERTRPYHADKCRGAFRYIVEGEILSVSCRGVRGQQNPATRKMEGSTEALDEWQAKAREIYNQAQTDPAAAMAYYESLTDATKAILQSSYTPLQRFAEQYFAKGGKSTPAAVLEARRYLEAYGEPTFFDWSHQWESTQRSFIMSDPDLKAVIQRQQAAHDAEMRRRLLGDAEQRPADETLVLVASVEAQAMALAGAVDLLSESPVDEDNSEALSELELGMETFLRDADTLQRMADQPGNQYLLQPAVGLMTAAADAGVKLELHKESLDEESLASLREAMVLVGEWASDLAQTRAPDGGDSGATSTVPA